jgi:hypothetical protein
MQLSDDHAGLSVRARDLDAYYADLQPSGPFDPVSASPADLARFGFPARPDSTEDPAGFGRWRRRFGRARHFVVPELRAVQRGRGGPASVSKGEAEGIGTSDNWAGNVLTAGAGVQFTGIMGMWTVPTVHKPLSGPFQQGAGNGFFASWSSSSWIGIDGYGTGDVFQAGVEHDLVAFDLFSELDIPDYYAWTEWFPAGPVGVGGFSVSPGDLMSVILTAHVTARAAPTGTALLLNATNGNFTTVPMQGPPLKSKTPFTGNSAEWIVETPCTANCGTDSAQFTELPQLGLVGFFDAEAITSKGYGIEGATGIADGNAPATATLVQLNMTSGGNGPGRTTPGAVVATELPLGFGVMQG